MKFYVGQYYRSVDYFTKAVLYRDKVAKEKTREHVTNYLFLALSQFRIGNASTADKTFNQCISLSEFVGESCRDLGLMAQANLALSKVHQGQLKEAAEIGRKALESAERFYSKVLTSICYYCRYFTPYNKP